MKTVSIIVKLLVALAAIAGAIYVAATYGDKIVAWCKKFINTHCIYCCDCDCDCDCGCDCECCCEEAAEETPVAAEADFEG